MKQNTAYKIRHPLLELARARTMEFLRDPGALFWVFLFPVIIAIVLGFAFRTPPDEQVTDPGVRYIVFLMPGLIGLNIMGSSMWGIGYTIVDTRRRKLLKRFAATPMHRWHYMLSLMLSRLFFLIIEVGLLVTFGWLVFDVAVHGSIAAVAVLAIFGSCSFSGLALLVATRTESTEVASGWMNAVQIPMWLGSGAFFSYTRFPEYLHPLIKALPLTALNDGLRYIINDGGSIFSLGPELVVLAAWGFVLFALTLKFFKWQ